MEIIRLNKRLPELKVFLNFKFPWVSNRIAYNFEEMSRKRQVYEMNLEKTVINDADAAVSVAKQMALFFSYVGVRRSICMLNVFEYPEDKRILVGDFFAYSEGVSSTNGSNGKIILITRN